MQILLLNKFDPNGIGYNVESWEISEIYLRGGIRDIKAICYVRFCRTISSFF